MSAHRASPLDPYTAALYPASDEAGQAAVNAAIQDSVAACMKKQGFAYTPDPEAVTQFSADSLDVEWGSEEFAKTYGYGISLDLSSAMGGSRGPRTDPNQAYIDSLTAGEQAAYSDALWGPAPQGAGDSGTASVATTDYDWTAAGCMGAAQHEHDPVAGPADDPQYAALTEQMSTLPQKAAEAPAVKQKENEWSSCLAEAGFPGYEHKDDPAAHFSAQMQTLMASKGPGTSGSAPATPDAGALTALQGEEIATATADFGCARDTGYADALAAERTRVEQAFVDENREQLDALVARQSAE